jgi:hypothetical protein
VRRRPARCLAANSKEDARLNTDGNNQYPSQSGSRNRNNSTLKGNNMTTRSTWYFHQSIAASGLAVMDSRIAWELRPDLWSGAQDCGISFRKNQKADGVQRMTATFEGFGPVLVFARSLDNLAKRLEWIVGRPVQELKPADPDAQPAVRTDFNQREVNAKEAERMEQVRKLAVEALPSHDCQRRRDIVAARQELGMPAV